MPHFLSVQILSTFIFLSGFILLQAGAIRWLSVYKFRQYSHLSTAVQFSNSECNSLSQYGFKKPQITFCKHVTYSSVMYAVIKAAHIAVYYCGQTYANNRWNCSSAKLLPKRNNDLTSGTREQAIVHAYASASLVLSIATECSNEKVINCPCGSPIASHTFPNNTFIWGGCHDNVDFAQMFAKKFLGFPADDNSFLSEGKAIKSKSIRRLMDLHNYNAGFELMRKHRTVKCRCHGVSGSCSTKTCFAKLTRIDDSIITNELRQLHSSALHVTKSDKNRLVKVKDEVDDIELAAPSNKLVYYTISPDYCSQNDATGSFGTQGRYCNSTTDGSFSCENMCCRRGYRTETQSIKKKCNCRLIHSPEIKVVCEMCTDVITVNICS